MKKFICAVMLFVLMNSFFGFDGEVDAAGKFRDVPSTHWASNEILYLSNIGIINGFNDGSFKPETTVTRAQAAIMLVRSLNLSLKNRPNPGFKDVSTKHGAYNYIAAIIDEGIYPKGTYYSPDQPLTRQEMARMLVNAYSLEGNQNITYKDVPKTYWAQPYISILSENGIAAGYSNGTYKPTTAVSRAQFSVFMSRSLDDRFKVNTPVPSKSTPVLMKDIKIGMTVQQVLNRETRLLVENVGESNFTALVYSTNKYDYTSELTYLFEDNKLMFAVYNFFPDGDYYHDIYEMIDFHNILHNEAVKEFGYDFFYFEEDYPYNSFTTYWDKGTYVALVNIDDEELITTAELIYAGSVVRNASVDNSEMMKGLLLELEHIQEVFKSK